MIYFKDLGNYGRIGNSLFQAATTIATALRFGDDYRFPQWDLAPYFYIPLEKFTSTLPVVETYEEPFFHYQSIPKKDNLNLKGYWQSYKYFEDYSNEIKQLLTPNCQVNQFKNTCSIHVRRSDYLSPALNGCFEILGMEYYNEAMKLIKAPKYLVFSDDIEWCKSNFKGEQFIFMEGNLPVFDLALMSSATNHIIANSSFSWFAAWLNKNPEKKIIVPKKWFGPKLQHNTKDLIPQDWICI